MAGTHTEIWARFRRHRMAWISLWFLVFLGAVALLAPWVVPDDPALQRPFVGALRPMSVVPDLAQENRFLPGRPAETSRAITTCSEVELLVVERPLAVWRIVCRRGVVSAITSEPGPKAIESLTIPLGAIRITEDSTRVPFKEGVRVETGQEPPASLFPDGPSGVAMVELSEGTDRPVKIVVRSENGVVQSVTRDGTALPSGITVAGANVTQICGDGKPLTRRHFLGTDTIGRDCLSRVIYGLRISLLVGLVATAVSLLIGVLYGAVSGWVGGMTDRMLMGLVDVLYGIPFMFLVILLLVFFGSNILILFAALGAVQWLTMARIVRSQVLSLRTREFISAAILGGASNLTILHRHLIPNCLGPIAVYATLTVPMIIMEESFLAFIGLKVEWREQSLESLGALVDAGAQAMSVHPWLLIVPAMTMAGLLLALNLVGDGLRDALDPRVGGH